MIAHYTSDGKQNACCCQMCKKGKPKMFIEVNAIDATPKYFFYDMRLSLCLECSKMFESMRNDDQVRDEFLDRIKRHTLTDEKTVEIPIGDQTLTFTGKHFAVVQEILKRLDEQV